jgi:hypothetical protein
VTRSQVSATFFGARRSRYLPYKVVFPSLFSFFFMLDFAANCNNGRL